MIATTATTSTSTARETSESEFMERTVPLLRHAGYHMGDAVAVEMSECVREYRHCTDGLGSRFRLTGHNDMRAEKRTSPHGYALLFLRAGRAAGLPRAWAERFVCWQQVIVARLWADDRTSYDVLEQREQEAENVANVAHLRAMRHNTPENRERLFEARLVEAAAELAVLSHPEAR